MLATRLLPVRSLSLKVATVPLNVRPAKVEIETAAAAVRTVVTGAGAIATVFVMALVIVDRLARSPDKLVTLAPAARLIAVIASEETATLPAATVWVNVNLLLPDPPT